MKYELKDIFQDKKSPIRRFLVGEHSTLGFLVRALGLKPNTYAGVKSAPILHQHGQIWGLAFALLLLSCKTEIQLDTEFESFVVIGGVITNSSLERIISVTATDGLGQPTPVGASGSLFKNGVKVRALDLIGTGQLVVPDRVKIEEGAEYFVEIETADGNIYRTEPQVVAQRRKTDSLSFGISQRVVGENSTGSPRLGPFVDIYAHVEVEDGNGLRPKPNFRWQVDEAWEVRETGGELRTCYPNNPVWEFPSSLLAARNAQIGSNSVLVASRKIDDSFLHKHYFNVYLHPIDARASEYYRQIERLVSDKGTIYDEILALVKGNVFNVDKPEERVMGYVEFSLADTVRISITRSQTRQQILDFCTELEDPCGFSEKCRCFDCEAVYGTRSLNRPAYWE